ncbi:3-hydroxyisobutyrate dehydrogenase [Exidia glandulosa HHB12029]|uniref:3-hydroxyisobutyrate dehydrogenase n=1 Tax=Exidia glandulosa HHB12029 TaxID=1314781 RepID=A0A165D9I5_EXIGL|nr:3-hydroxyisobutyrate dehydrogenase [Exidia glandulosa HHB12029]
MAAPAQVLRSRTLGFIGLGRMGFEMARNLFTKQPGASFVVCDANQTAAQAFVSQLTSLQPHAKISVASTPAEVALASQVVITMVPSTPQVAEVYTGASGILSALRELREPRETLCIDSTTLDVDYARQVASLVTEVGATMVDAPVSGGVAGAAAGTLSFLVGGTQPAFRQAEPLLASMGKRIIHCGPSGSGLAAKICNNLMLGVQQIATAEAMLLGEELGLDPAVLASVVNSSTGACWASSVNNPVPGALPDKEPPCTRDFEGGFAAALMLKDMNLASQAAVAADSPMPLGEAAKFLYEEVVKHDGGRLARKDFSVVYQFLREVNAEAGVEEDVDDVQ